MTMQTQQPQWKWKRYEVRKLSLALDVLDAPLLEGATAEGGWLLQTVHPLQIGLWYGPGQTLAKWVADLQVRKGVTIGPQRKVRIGDLPGHMQQASGPEEMVEGGFIQALGELELRSETRPAWHAVSVDFETKDTPVLICWHIEAAWRETYRSAEGHFFNSIQRVP